jgi:hypothetical protein
MFKVNEASWDRIVRVLLGIALLFLGLGGALTGGLGVTAAIVGVVLLLTGLVGWCPLYALFKLSTKKA